MKSAVKTQSNTGMFRAMLRVVQRVPRGKVATYGDIAYAAGFPGAARQVAWALHGSSLGVPWQRVIGAGGRILLTGHPGVTQRLKLESEGVPFLGLRVDIKKCHCDFRMLRPLKKKTLSKKKSRT